MQWITLSKEDCPAARLLQESRYTRSGQLVLRIEAESIVASVDASSIVSHFFSIISQHLWYTTLQLGHTSRCHLFWDLGEGVREHKSGYIHDDQHLCACNCTYVGTQRYLWLVTSSAQPQTQPQSQPVSNSSSLINLYVKTKWTLFFASVHNNPLPTSNDDWRKSIKIHSRNKSLSKLKRCEFSLNSYKLSQKQVSYLETTS